MQKPEEDMNNRAEKFHFAKGYLAGLIDGEGSLTINVHRCKRKIKLQVSIGITNTDEKIMEKAEEMAKLLSLPFYFQQSTRITKNKPIIRILIHGLQRCEKWLNTIPFQGKNEQAEIMRNFIKSRKKRIKEFSGIKPYTEEEMIMTQDLRNLHNQNRRGNDFVRRQFDLYKNQINSILWRREKTMALIKKGWTQTKIAKFFGVNSNTVSEWLKRNEKLSETTIGTLRWEKGKRTGAILLKE